MLQSNKRSNAIDLDSYIQSNGDQINQRLNKLVPDRNVPYSQLFQAARYSLLSGGKRLRPILTLATTEVLEGNLEAALSPACTIELIHTYSLIHDDLPCMDDDDYRRGKPTLHKVFSESHAVLAGDFLLTYAFEVIADDPLLSAEQKVALIRVLAKNAGGIGMIAGQLMDLEAEKKQIDLSTLQLIHKNKTGALITAAIEFGAIVANASPEITETLKQFGRDIGHAFQIIDDVLDDKEGSDLTKGKATYVSLLGLEKAQETAYTILSQSLKNLESLPMDTTLLNRLAHHLVNRDN